ncbi:MAG: hypothetical protein C4538_05135 [Nitrospiraceae bacterium]|nr:MAG: hypothetical protein C4538_05135 [Nitrospiraceae bacterium]
MRTLFIALSLLFLLLIYGPEIFAENNSAPLTARVTVLPTLKYETIHQEDHIVVTNEDINRGYIDINNAITIKIKTNSNSGLFITFFTNNDFPQGAIVSTNTGSLKIQDSNNELYIPYNEAKSFTKDLSFRFYLSSNTTPGYYDWPVSFMVSSAY